MNFLDKEIHLSDKKVWKNIVIGIIYFCSVIIIITLGKSLIRLPFDIANEYNVQIDSVEQIASLFPSNFATIFIGLLLIAILALPVFFLLGRIKKISKDGGEFYRNDEIQVSEKVTTTQNGIYAKKVVENIINSDDSKNGDEIEEKLLIENVEDKKDAELVLLKCQNIKNRMLPLTVEVTRELYNHCKMNINCELVLEYVKQLSKYKIKKNTQDKSEKIAKSIIDFLNKNDIIEADDGYDNKFYFTFLGEKFMQYYFSGKI